MPNGFLDIPDWFSWDNAGAGIALADLNGDGTPDLVVFMVDDPQGKNSGLYRIGRSLDDDGAVTGGWTDWLPVPEWFSWANAGAGIAIADVTGDGMNDLVVFMVDDPDGQNQGFFRVGKGLTADGAVTGGWTDWAPVPDWFAWANAGAGVAVADVSGDGTSDLVVFMVDDPEEQNQGLYRVGFGLNADGAVTGGWSDWTPVPDWFSWFNAGAGVTVADVDNAGLLDLIVFQVDAPEKQNQGFYRIGRKLGPDGTVGGGWGTWLGVPGWFSWENQGASVAVARIGGRQRLAVLLVDNAEGQNSASYRLLDLEPDPATQGSWEVLPFLSEVLAVHAGQLPGGKVLFFAGSGSSKVRFTSPDLGNEAKGIWTSALWDPAQNGPAAFEHPHTLRGADGKVLDFFCCGHTWLADGTLLVGGGSLDYPDGPHGFLGRDDVQAFDPVTGQWSERAAMHHARWYPTLVSLGDGKVLATSGLLDGPGVNTQLEVYDPAADAWELLPAPPPHDFPGLPLYAHLFLLEDGRVFFSGGRMDDGSPLGPVLLDLGANPVTVTGVPGLEEPETRNQSASVLLPPAQEQRVMIIGGGPEDESNATDKVDVVDLSGPNPQYQPAAPLSLPRMHLNAVLLPDRTVLVCGGSLDREDEIVARRQAEIYDPATDTWKVMATATVSRLYHSTAVLLADGRVVTAGGNPEGGHQVNWVPPDEDEELRLEVFSPPYLFRGPRPEITGGPDEAGYGDLVEVQSPQAGAIKWVSLVRPGITTHAFDSSQRLVDAPIESQGGGVVRLRIPDEPNLAPPGWYMLFLVDGDGVPSIAHWIRLG
jgi:hypothetical protein